MEIVFVQDRSAPIQDNSQSILSVSLAAGIPHVHACGGHARCSTCRVLVIEGIEHLDPRNEPEDALARRKGFEDNIRLACQTRACSDLTVRRLVRDQLDTEVAMADSADIAKSSGREMKLAVMFTDIRGYTTFSEGSLPYDTVHILNRHFRLMGDIVLQNHGFIDKYIGDGMMAIFGLEPQRDGCFDAVHAGMAMSGAMNEFNRYLRDNFNATLEIGVGIHYGTAVIGNIGHPGKMQFTAIGDTVNTASRIESFNKTAGTHLLISEAVRSKLGDRVIVGHSFDAELKGKEGTHRLYSVERLSD